MSTVVFAIVAAVTLLSAVFVVHSRNLVHAVMWLALSLLGTAALYALLDSPFLSGIQVLTYVGGVVTLMIFGVMITRKHDGSVIPAGGVQLARGAVVAIGLFAVLFFAVSKTDLSTGDVPQAPTTREMAHDLLDLNLFAFEAASLLLLAAIVGAVVLVRRRDHDNAAQREPTALDEIREKGMSS
jgi:NADH-quinone oxidoreductase subunit J